MKYQFDNDVLLEKVFKRILLEYTNKKSNFAGSHPEEYYIKDWHELEAEWFDKKGKVTWDEDRQWTKEYLRSIGLLK